MAFMQPGNYLGHQQQQHANGSGGVGSNKEGEGQPPTSTSPQQQQQQEHDSMAALGALLEDNYAILNSFKTNMQQCKVRPSLSV